MAQKKKAAGKAGTIKRGTCRTIKGSVRICATKTGKLYTTALPKRRRKKAGTKTTARKTTAKAKPKQCRAKPTKTAKNFKGKCSCISKKTGKRIKVGKTYCAKKRPAKRKAKK